MNQVLSFSNVYKSFGEKVILSGVSFDVHDTETFVLFGKSGQGKSVLLKIMVGLLAQDHGEVSVFGQDPAYITEDELFALRLKIGMVFQNGAMFDSMTVGENLEFPLHVHTKMSEQEIHDQAHEYLEDVGLKGSFDKYPYELSGGMKKRASLARTLIMKPRIILYDEPTTGLDPLITNDMSELIRSMTERFKITSVIVTHDLKFGFSLASSIGILNDGKLLIKDRPEKVLQSEDPFVKEFLSAAVFQPAGECL